jgi:hypothetical protein
MWDRAATQISATILIAGGTRFSNRLPVDGARRYRLKILTGVIDVSIEDLSLRGNALIPWETVLLGTTVAATRTTFNFGQGTGILECMCGPALRIRLFNSGGFNTFIDEVELWAQW